MKKSILILLVLLLAAVVDVISSRCSLSKLMDSKKTRYCGLKLSRGPDGCLLSPTAVKGDSNGNVPKCWDSIDNIKCYCQGDDCNRNELDLYKKFENFFVSNPNHPLQQCISVLLENTLVCAVTVFVTNNVCSATKVCQPGLPPPSPDCSVGNGNLTCSCLGHRKQEECSANTDSVINKLRTQADSLNDTYLNTCVNEFAEQKWPQTKTILDHEYSYECEGTHVGGWKGVKVCGILMTKHDDGTCLLEQQSRSLAVSHDVVPACQNEGNGVICYCITNNCNNNEDNLHFGAYLEESNHPAKSCMKMITSKVMSLHQIKKINVSSYECIGDGSKFWESDNNRCGVMISVEDGECHSKQTSRSVGAGQDTPCCAEDKNVICFCLGDHCNEHQKSFYQQFEQFYRLQYGTTGNAPITTDCREMTAVYDQELVKTELCAVALEEGSDKVCQLVKNDCFSSYQPVSLGCHTVDKDVRCFCEGEGCNQNPYDLAPQFDKFFAESLNHSKSGCYSKMRETTTTSSPTTTEENEYSNTSEETDEIDGTKTIETSTDSPPGSGSDGSELEGEQTLTTRKDVETEKLVEDDGKEEGKEGKGRNEGSNNPLIISSSAGVIFLVVVAVIVGCCFWKRNGGNKKGKPSKEGVIEVQPKPYFGPLPLPPTPATPAPSTPAVPLTPAPSTPAVPMSPATSTPAVPMSPATPIPVVPLTPATPTPAAPLTPTAPAKAAKKRKVRAPRKLSAGEIIAKREAKRLRREELKRKAEIPVDVLSDRRFEKKGPLHFINVQRELPDEPLSQSGTMTGTGPVEFDDRGNELFYLGTDIEIIDDSIRTRPTQDEDDVEKTQSDDVEEKKKDKKKKRKKSKGTGQKRKKKRRTSKNNVSSKK